MKREWYTYASTVKGVSSMRLRELVPQALLCHLLNDTQLSRGIHVEASDTALIAELDTILQVGKTKDVVKWLNAEVNQDSISEYEYYLVSFPLIATNPNEPPPIVACTTSEYLSKIDFHWPPKMKIGIRELSIQLAGGFDRVTIVNEITKNVIESAKLKGIQFVPLPGKLWWIEVERRLIDHADCINPNADYDSATHSVVSGYSFFGLRRESADFGNEDLQVIDRIEAGGTLYPYRMPWLVASRKFVELCLANKVSRLQFPNVLFKHGLVPVLVGRGHVTSTLDRYSKDK